MQKINFTKEHDARLKELSTEMLFDKTVINGNMGQVYTVFDLIHTTTIGTLRNIYNSLVKSIEKSESADEWIATDNDQRVLADFKRKKEFVNLLIGYKRYQNMLDENRSKRAVLEAELARLQDAQKTPEDRIKELQSEIEMLRE